MPCGIMDQLTSAAGVAGHALLIDCHDLGIEPVPLPDDVEVVVVHSGVPRTLAGSAYADRRRECEAAEADIGPLRLARPGDERSIDDPVLRRRARHVLTENAAGPGHGGRARARATSTRSAACWRPATPASATTSRCPCRRSTTLVDRLAATDGVHGARMTGGGFGGCVVALDASPVRSPRGGGSQASAGAARLSFAS